MICTVMPDIVQQYQQQHFLTFRTEQPHDFEIEALTSAAVDKVTMRGSQTCITALACIVLSCPRLQARRCTVVLVRGVAA